MITCPKCNNDTFIIHKYNLYVKASHEIVKITNINDDNTYEKINQIEEEVEIPIEDAIADAEQLLRLEIFEDDQDFVECEKCGNTIDINI